MAMPRLLNTKPMRALLDMSRTSIGRHIVTPTPTAGPLIAATMGLRQLKICQGDGIGLPRDSVRASHRSKPETRRLPARDVRRRAKSATAPVTTTERT